MTTMRACLIAIVGCLLMACSVSDGGRTLVVLPNPAESKRTGDTCIDAPVEAYIKGFACNGRSPITPQTANARLDVIRGGCALQASMLWEKFEILEEILKEGGDFRRCPGYPSSIYAAVAHMCRDKQSMAHRFFDVLEKNKVYSDNPQILLFHSTLYRCVEGVKIALAYGATPNRPARKNWDDGLLHPMELFLPLESATIAGTRGYADQMVAITKILVAAGASPWETDVHGETIFSRAQKAHISAPYWPRLSAALRAAEQ